VVVVRPATDGDADALAGLVTGTLDAHLIHHGRVLVATEQVGVIGCGVICENRWHPKRASIALWPGDGQGWKTVSRMLLAALRELDARPVRVRLRGDDPAGLSFWASVGLQPLIVSHLVTVDSNDPVVRDWAATVAGPDGVELRDFGTEPSTVELAALAAFYERVHRWDPPRTMSAADVRRDLAGDLLIGVAAWAEGSIVAVGAVHEGAQGLQEAALIGSTLRDDDTMAAWMLATLLSRVPGHLEIEADEGVGAASDLVRALRDLPTAQWGETVVILSDTVETPAR